MNTVEIWKESWKSVITSGNARSAGFSVFWLLRFTTSFCIIIAWQIWVGRRSQETSFNFKYVNFWNLNKYLYFGKIEQVCILFLWSTKE